MAKILTEIANRALANTPKTNNDIIAENGKVLKAYMFIVWLYLFKKFKLNEFFFFPSDALYGPPLYCNNLWWLFTKLFFYLATQFRLNKTE